VEGTRQIEPDWVAVVRSAVPVSEGAELRDAEGRVVATLTRVGIAPANPPTPLLTPVPDAAPVTQQDLVGVWAASDGRVLELRADGRALPQDCGWRAQGHWTVTDTSTLIHAGPGSSPAAWCEQESLVLEPAGAGVYSVGLRAGDLVIMDSEGSEAILTRTDS
jgi:hypothetical protein